MPKYKVFRADGQTGLLIADNHLEAASQSIPKGYILSEVVSKDYANLIVQGQRTTKYYKVFANNTHQGSPLAYVKRWFELVMDNWYESWKAEGDEPSDDMFYPQDYVTDVRIKGNTILLNGVVTGCYSDGVEERHQYTTESLRMDLEADVGFKLGVQYSAKDTKDGVVVTPKGMSLDKFIQALVQG